MKLWARLNPDDMAHTISTKFAEYWQRRAVEQEEALQKFLAGMTESERIGYLAMLGSFS